MESFGETLKAEREDRGLTIENVARILGVDQERLRALERNDFGALPDEDTMLSCLQDFAECLEVDAELMIADYVKERDRWLGQLDQGISEQPVERSADEAVPAPAAADASSSRRGPRLVGALIAGAAIVIVAGWWLSSRDGSSSSAPAPSAADPQESHPSPPVDSPTAQPVELSTASPEASIEPAPVRSASQAPDDSTASRDAGTATDRNLDVPAPAEAARSSGLSIPDSGIGTGVDNRQLVGRNSRFSEGTSAWFWTYVEGGTRGERIDHVWFHDGAETARVSLNIGGSRWRTHSRKMFRPGSADRWTVEARDGSGRILASHKFVVEPAPDS